MEEQAGQSSAERRGEAEGQIRQLAQAKLSVSEGCLHNDAFKAYKNTFTGSMA